MGKATSADWLKCKVSARLHAKGQSITGLARRLGMNCVTLALQLKNANRMRPQAMAQFTEILGVDLAWMTNERVDDALVNLSKLHVADWDTAGGGE